MKEEFERLASLSASQSNTRLLSATSSMSLSRGAAPAPAFEIHESSSPAAMPPERHDKKELEKKRSVRDGVDNPPSTQAEQNDSRSRNSSIAVVPTTLSL